jgi:hypothetical protein
MCFLQKKMSLCQGLNFEWINMKCLIWVETVQLIMNKVYLIEQSVLLNSLSYWTAGLIKQSILLKNLKPRNILASIQPTFTS